MKVDEPPFTVQYEAAQQTLAVLTAALAHGEVGLMQGQHEDSQEIGWFACIRAALADGNQIVVPLARLSTEVEAGPEDWTLAWSAIDRNTGQPAKRLPDVEVRVKVDEGKLEPGGLVDV